MPSRILTTAAALALVLIQYPFSSSARQPVFPSQCSASSNPAGNDTPQRLTPEGVLQLRALLAGLTSVTPRDKPVDKFAIEAQEFYACLDYSLPWISSGQPTEQARKVIEELKHADEKGLYPEDYGGTLWDARIAAFLNSNQLSEELEIHFDLDLTLSAMWFLSDLHVGRVNPQDLHFELDTGGKSLDLSEFLQRELIHVADIDAGVESVEPQFLAYRRTLQALHRYLTLARNDSGETLHAPSRSFRVLGSYDGLPRLVKLLQTLGDLDSSETKNWNTYDVEISAAVRRFQQRHGLNPSGLLDARTLAQLNTPLSHRVLQLQLALERWRWLPQTFTRPPIIVNIPEFRLYAVEKDHHVAFSMKIVVGRAYHHETPVFESEIKSVIFRPYWNVPFPIQRDELAPLVEKDPLYLTKNSYEVTDSQGRLIANADQAPELKDKLRSGGWLLRQRPGPENSLGLLKFDVPSTHDVYLHGTPAQELFARSRRDFSHGCIRVENPIALAAWVLRGNRDWTTDRIHSAMEGDETLRVNLDKPVPVWIVYGTAVVHETGEILFFQDIYGHDAALVRALELRDSRAAY